MAILTLDALFAGAQQPRNIQKANFTSQGAGFFHSLAYTAGQPGSMVVPAMGLNGAFISAAPVAFQGALDFVNPGGGSEQILQAISLGQNGNIGGIRLYDRVWHNSGIVPTTTTAQAITFPGGAPGRDINGTALGDGWLLGLEVSTATTNGAPVTTITVDYTNEANVNTRTATITSFPANAVAGTFVPFYLQAGDKGVRSIQGITLGTSLGTGVVHLVLYRPIVTITQREAGAIVTADASIDWGRLRLYDGSALFMLASMTGTNGGANGLSTYGQWSTSIG